MADDAVIDQLLLALAAKCALLRSGDPLGMVFAATTDLLLAAANNGLNAKKTKYTLKRLIEVKERTKSSDKKTDEAERSLVYGLSDLIVIMFKKLENRGRVAEFEAIMNKRTIASSKEPMFADDSLSIVDVVDITQPINEKRRDNFDTMDFSNQLDDFDSLNDVREPFEEVVRIPSPFLNENINGIQENTIDDLTDPDTLLDENQNLIIENQLDASTHEKNPHNMHKSPGETCYLGTLNILENTQVYSEDQNAIGSDSIDNEQPPPASTTRIDKPVNSFAIDGLIGDLLKKNRYDIENDENNKGTNDGEQYISRKRPLVDPSSSSERKYKCDICMKYMLTWSHLRDHKLIHTGDRPEKCKVEKCSAAFATAAKLMRHMRNSHHINQFKCNNCDIVFKKKIELIKHYEHVGCHLEDSERYIIPK